MALFPGGTVGFTLSGRTVTRAGFQTVPNGQLIPVTVLGLTDLFDGGGVVFHSSSGGRDVVGFYTRPVRDPSSSERSAARNRVLLYSNYLSAAEFNRLLNVPVNFASMAGDLPSEISSQADGHFSLSLMAPFIGGTFYSNLTSSSSLDRVTEWTAADPLDILFFWLRLSSNGERTNLLGRLTNNYALVPDAVITVTDEAVAAASRGVVLGPDAPITGRAEVRGLTVAGTHTEPAVFISGTAVNVEPQIVEGECRATLHVAGTSVDCKAADGEWVLDGEPGWVLREAEITSHGITVELYRELGVRT